MKNKLIVTISIVFAVIVIVLGIWSLVKLREMRIKIELYGIETIGTVIHKSRGGNRHGGRTFAIRFEFEDNNGKRVVVTNSSPCREDYDNAVIGMAYVVKYLPNNPKRAVILIDRPVKRDLDPLAPTFTSVPIKQGNER